MADALPQDPTLLSGKVNDQRWKALLKCKFEHSTALQKRQIGEFSLHLEQNINH
jgi:hypothetical protein